jgi:hypothetical protein
MPATITVTLGGDVIHLLAFVAFLVAGILAAVERWWVMVLIAAGLALTVLPHTPLA